MLQHDQFSGVAEELGPLDSLCINFCDSGYDLVGGLEHVLFFHILGTISPTDEYFSEGLTPPTGQF